MAELEITAGMLLCDSVMTNTYLLKFSHQFIVFLIEVDKYLFTISPNIMFRWVICTTVCINQ